VKIIENVITDKNDRPFANVTIANSGELELKIVKPAGSQATEKVTLDYCCEPFHRKSAALL
jgi:hypothetical protein